MDTVISSVKQLAAQADEATRKSIIDSIRALADSLETSDDTVTRLWGYTVQASVTRVAIDLGLFNILDASEKPLLVDEIAAKTKSDKTLLARLLRFLAAFSLIKETSQDEFASSYLTPTLANAGNQGALKHYFDTCGPCYQEMPAFFQRTAYQNPTDLNHTVFQDAHKCKENCFDWMMAHPTEFSSFNQYMASRREHQITWLDRYPLTRDATGLSPERVLLVDVGGGIGHSCAEFKAKYPDLPGQVILQDLPFAIEHAIPTPGVKKMAHDFTTPQPIKGAKFYYLRAVLHDWPDDKVELILKRTIDALASDSIILVDDIVAPNKGVNWQVAQIDVTMMAAGASMERTEQQWEKVFNTVDLKIHDRVVYTPGMHETVTALVKK